MTYTSPHIYVTFGGALPGDEIWQTGVRFKPDGWPSALAFISWDAISVVDVAAAVSTWYGAAAMYFSSDTTLKWVKLAAIREDGTYDREPKVHEYTTGTAGAATDSARVPLQISNVVSLWSGSSFGRANFSRMYLPPQNLSRASGSPGFNPAVIPGILGATKTMLQAVEGELSTVEQDYSLAIMSNLGSGTTKAVSQLRMGPVYDTQRRRRQSLVETYQTVAW